MDGGDDATRALAREVGRQSVERLGDGLTRIIGESSALYRWLLTMLVALNAAGLWALVSFPAILTVDGRSVATLFFLGLLAAIFAAVLSLLFTWPVARAMRRAITYWTEVAVSGELTDDAMLSAKRVKIMSSLWLTLTSVMGAASLILFITGVTTAGGGVVALGRTLDLIPPEALAPPAENGADVANDVADLLNQSVPANAATGPVATTTPSPAVAPPSRPAPAPVTRSTPRPAQTARPTPQPQRPAAAPPPAAPSPAPAPVTPAPAPVAPPPAETP